MRVVDQHESQLPRLQSNSPCEAHPKLALSQGSLCCFHDSTPMNRPEEDNLAHFEPATISFFLSNASDEQPDQRATTNTATTETVDERL